MKKIKNKFKKIILVFLTVLIAIFSFVPKVYAQDTTWYQQPYDEWFAKVTDSTNPTEIFGERYTYAQVQWIIYSLAAFAMTGGNKELGNTINCLMQKEVGECSDSLDIFKDLFENLYSTSRIPQETNLAHFFRKQSVSGVGYVLNKLADFSLVPEARAQEGFGYSANNVIMKLWKSVRDVSYLLLTIAVVILAFMIMFKVKINPQTVITIQSALPRVIVAILLITFSYAIAGFFIDIMYVVLGLLSAIVVRADLTNWEWSQLFHFITTGASIILLLLNYWFAFIIAIFANKLFVLGPATGFGIWAVLSSGVAITSVVFAAGGWIILFLILFLVIALIVIIVQIFKTIVLLLKTFLQITLLIIISPLQILLGVINPAIGFPKWARSMAANLAVYPVVAFLLILAFFFLRHSLPFGYLWFIVPFHFEESAFDYSQGTWDPPLTFGTGENGYKFLLLLSSVGIISMIPKTSEMIKAFIEGRPFDMQSAMAEAIMKPYQGIMNWGPMRELREAQSIITAEKLLSKLPTSATDEKGIKRIVGGAVSAIGGSEVVESLKEKRERLKKGLDR